MPIYEYRCDLCGHDQEAIQKMSDAPLKLCASCGKEGLARVISRTSFMLKGSGWYATDYKPAPKDTSASTSSTPSTSTKSDT